MKACIGLGSNLGDRLAMLRAAREALDGAARMRVLRASRVYETAPVGPGDQGPYLNAALLIETEWPPRALLGRLLEIERGLGRDRSAAAVRWGPRTIDLDLLLAGDLSIEEPGLELPHPRLHERAFVLVPLAEVAPEARHPGLGVRIDELAARAPGLDQIACLETVGTADWL